MVGVDASPVLDDGEDILGRHVGEGDVVLGRKGQDVADALDALCSQEQGFDIICIAARAHVLIIGLLLLHGAVVVDKRKRLFVLRVGVPRGAGVSRTQIALR